MLTIADRRFLRALRRETKQFNIEAASAEVGDAKADATWDVGTDDHGFYSATIRELGRLWGQLFVQAQGDGASRIRLHYSEARMYYMIEGSDYEMIPPPAPLNVDMCRLLARASRLRWDAPGRLNVPFADRSLELIISHEGSAVTPSFLEISGFTGIARHAAVRINKSSPGRLDAGHPAN